MICPVCGIKFTDEKKLVLHYRKIHIANTKDRNEILSALDSRSLQNLRLARRWRKLQEEEETMYR